MELDDRKIIILKTIIKNYLETGEPVGSRTISKYSGLNLSSATIRNEMSDLEEMGYIIQPHTSAGRIPSDKGYRFYVDSIMQESDLFLFTSVAEGTPHVVLEAVGNNLPVLCFDTCGQGDCVNDKVGIKIELSNPKQSICEFAGILNELEANRNKLQEMADNCKARQQELSWESKAKQMVELYQKTLNSFQQ